MACQLAVYNTQTKVKNQYTCDEQNASKVVEDDHAAKATGQYTDTSGKSFSVDWTQCRLVSFNRQQA